jgi:hypothetical protein
MLISPVNSNLKNCFGAKNYIVFGFSVVSATTFALGYVTVLKNPHYFMYATLGLRFL